MIVSVIVRECVGEIPLVVKKWKSRAIYVVAVTVCYATRCLCSSAVHRFFPGWGIYSFGTSLSYSHHFCCIYLLSCLSYSINWFCNKGGQVANGFSRIPWCKEFAGIFPHTHTHTLGTLRPVPPPVWLLVPTFRNPRASVQVQVSPTVVHCCTCLSGSTQQRPIKKPSSCWAAYNTNWGAHFQAIWAFLQAFPVWKVKTYLEDRFFVFHVLNLRDNVYQLMVILWQSDSARWLYISL